MRQAPTAAGILAQGVQALREAGIPDAAADARRLLAHALGVEPGRLTIRLAEGMSPAQSAAFGALLARRIRREPVSQILGERLFWGRSFRVTRDTLDPRPRDRDACRLCAGRALCAPARSGDGDGLSACHAAGRMSGGDRHRDRPFARGVGGCGAERGPAWRRGAGGSAPFGLVRGRLGRVRPDPVQPPLHSRGRAGSPRARSP